VITVAISLPSGRAAIRIAREKKAEADVEDASPDEGSAPTEVDPARTTPGA
jgi:DHA3 family macrolide efflux protein-like MFS transporter